MKNVYEVLRQKELYLLRLQKEVEALRVVAPLLSEDSEAGNNKQLALPGSGAPQPTEKLQLLSDTPQQPRASAWGDKAKQWLSG